MTLFFYLLSFSTFLSALIIYGMSFATSLVEMSDSNIRVTLRYRWLAWFRWIAMSIAWAAPPLLIGLPLQNDNGSVNWLTILSIYAIIATIAILGLHSLPGGIKVDQPRFRLSTITLFGIAMTAIMTNVGLQFRDSFKSTDSISAFKANEYDNQKVKLHNSSSNSSIQFWLQFRWHKSTFGSLYLYNPNEDKSLQHGYFPINSPNTYLAFKDDSVDYFYSEISKYHFPDVVPELEKARFVIEGPLPGNKKLKRNPLVFAILLCTPEQFDAYPIGDTTENSTDSTDDILKFCRENKIWCFYLQTHFD